MTAVDFKGFNAAPLTLTFSIFNPEKPVETRGGRKARIICIDRNAGKIQKPIVALIQHLKDNYEEIQYFCLDGRIYPDRDDAYDLINIPTKFVRYMVIHTTYSRSGSRGCTSLFLTENEAQVALNENRPHLTNPRIVKVEWEE